MSGSNFEHIFGSLYRVKTQAGFTQALYHEFGGVKGKSDPCYSRKDLRRSINDYPTSYPAIVQFIDHMFEANRIYVYWKSDDKTL